MQSNVAIENPLGTSPVKGLIWKFATRYILYLLTEKGRFELANIIQF